MWPLLRRSKDRHHRHKSSRHRKRSLSPFISSEDKMKLLEIAKANVLAQHRADSTMNALSQESKASQHVLDLVCELLTWKQPTNLKGSPHFPSFRLCFAHAHRLCFAHARRLCFAHARRLRFAHARIISRHSEANSLALVVVPSILNIRFLKNAENVSQKYVIKPIAELGGRRAGTSTGKSPQLVIMLIETSRNLLDLSFWWLRFSEGAMDPESTPAGFCLFLSEPEWKICEKMGPDPESLFNSGSGRSLSGHFLSKNMGKFRLDRR